MKVRLLFLCIVIILIATTLFAKLPTAYDQPTHQQVVSRYLSELPRHREPFPLVYTLVLYEEGMEAMSRGDLDTATARWRECQRLAVRLPAADAGAMRDATEFWIRFARTNAANTSKPQ